ncbi:MAG: hypothetical protein KDE03_17350 [Rhodobacteraceae bacterium]|nr:hypothetical protein [Paracoccaceae bacterium]
MTEPVRTRFPLWGTLAALAGFAALQALAAAGAGVFEYPLDDVYIHLAMAEGISRGTYGINPGEAASASSSILFPFLLLPFPGSDLQRLLPLFWNLLAVGGCGWVWGRIVFLAGVTGWAGAALVLFGPLCLNIPGVGFTGMEAAPHVLASLIVVLGLWRAMSGGGVASWFVAAAIAAPLLRYEGLALTLAAALALWSFGMRRAGLAIGLAAIGAVAAFSLFLLHLGLAPLPGSILAKSLALDPQGGAVQRAVLGVAINLSKPAGLLLALLLAGTALLAARVPGMRGGPAGTVLLAVWFSGLAHLIFGQIGWMNRYEPYILISLVSAMLLAGGGGEMTAGPRGPSPAPAALASLVVMLAAGAIYLPPLFGKYVWNPRAIHLQQAQMARFAQDYLKAPVAVNDLGRVAWRNPYYVLDLWGLGSAEARDIRFGPVKPAAGWADPLVKRHGVGVAMIYDRWFADAVGTDWVRVATLSTQDPKGVLFDWDVAIYATGADAVAPLRGKLAEFAPGLPEGATLVLEGGS